MSRRQAKRQAFAHLVAMITKQNRDKPGFIGVAFGFRFTDKTGRRFEFGPGAVFNGDEARELPSRAADLPPEKPYG